MAADRRVAYQLTISAGRSLKTLQDLTREAQASAAALAALDEAQTRAAASAAALGATRAPRGRAPASAAPTAAGGAGTSSGADPVAAASKEAAAQLRAEARARSAADRELERQRQAAVRQELGAIQGKAELERERIVRLRTQLEEQGRLGEKEADLVERRLRFIAEDAERQQQSLARRGVDPRAAFGATGTRQTTIGSGVLSGFFDQLLGDTGAAGAKLDDLRDAAGRADTSLKTLAGALGVVSPGAEAAATAAGDLVGSLEVLLTPAGATVGAMATAAAAIGAAGAAAVAATLHIAEVADELQRLDEIGAPTLIDPDQVDGIRDAAAAVHALSPAFSALVGVLAAEVAPAVEDFATSSIAALLLIRRGLEAADLEGIFEHLAASVVKTITLPIEGALRAVAALAEARAGLQESLGAGRDPLVDAIATGARSAIADLESFQVRAGKALVGIGRDTITGYAVGLRAATAEVRDEAEALVDAVRTAGEDTGGEAGGRPVRLSGGVETAVGEYGDAVEAAEDALQRLREIGQESRDSVLGPWEELRNRFARARMELEGLRTAAGPTGDALAGAAERAIDAEEARARAALVASSVEATNREIAAFDAQRRAELEARAARPGAAVQSFGGAVDQLSAGNLVGAVGAATGIPQVQVVGAALDALAQLGQLSEEELEQRGEDFARAVAAGIEVLPGLLIEVVPDIALALAEAVGEALLNFPDRIGEAVYEAITGREVESRGSVRTALNVINSGEADPAAILYARAVEAIRGDSRSRQAAARDLSGGVTLPRTGRGTPGREEGRAITVRGSGPGLARAIALEADAPYGRRWGVR